MVQRYCTEHPGVFAVYWPEGSDIGMCNSCAWEAFAVRPDIGPCEWCAKNGVESRAEIISVEELRLCGPHSTVLGMAIVSGKKHDDPAIVDLRRMQSREGPE